MPSAPRGLSRRPLGALAAETQRSINYGPNQYLYEKLDCRGLFVRPSNRTTRTETVIPRVLRQRDPQMSTNTLAGSAGVTPGIAMTSIPRRRRRPQGREQAHTGKSIRAWKKSSAK